MIDVKGRRIMNKPTIVCLCGSTKFKEEFIKANFTFTMEGKIVLSVGWFSHADKLVYYPTEEEKKMLDELHCRKIDIADEVFIINFNKYIGKSTEAELIYAYMAKKKIKFLEHQFDRIQLHEFCHKLGNYKD